MVLIANICSNSLQGVGYSVTIKKSKLMKLQHSLKEIK